MHSTSVRRAMHTWEKENCQWPKWNKFAYKVNLEHFSTKKKFYRALVYKPDVDEIKMYIKFDIPDLVQSFCQSLWIKRRFKREQLPTSIYRVLMFSEHCSRLWRFNIPRTKFVVGLFVCCDEPDSPLDLNAFRCTSFG